MRESGALFSRKPDSIGILHFEPEKDVIGHLSHREDLLGHSVPLSPIMGSMSLMLQQKYQSHKPLALQQTLTKILLCSKLHARY